MKLQPIQFTVFVIWAALIMGLVTMSFVITVQDGTRSEDSLTHIFALVAGVNCALSFVVRHFMLGGFRRGAVTIESDAGRGRYLTGHVIVFALSESIGVLGFVNGLNSRGETDAWLPFIGGSIMLLLFHIPLPSRFVPQGTRI
ncbi:MAG: hypothetical protein JNG86_09270 [Verrucomicrobiaceae bacterium]|nr:hypothetical protein [Verrucomicrobiaceae bacterium]